CSSFPPATTRTNCRSRTRGTSTVLVDVSWEEHADGCTGGWDDGHRLYAVPPGETLVRRFGHVHDIDVLITRPSGGLVLFYDEFDADDFSDDHGKIEIAVSPYRGRSGARGSPPLPPCYQLLATCYLMPHNCAPA
ncbi:MAG TPA: hypothetical protein VEJ18_09390, partial [Planctomycetota bacterium]|nr:hypothetical protein [Planctomycetota bacterium]